MTTLAIVPNHDKKRLKLTGTVAAGEHVAVTIKDGWAWASAEGASLRLRVVFAGKLLAEFPRRVKDGEEPPADYEWTHGENLADAACTFNFNTIPAEMWLVAGGNCLWVLDDPELNTLYGVGDLEVMPWHRAPGGEIPYNLDGYPDFVEEAKAAIEQAASDAQAAANAASASQVAATQARNAATESQTSALNSASVAAACAASAQSSAESAAGSAASAAEDASLATRAAIAKMRERTGSRLWHNVSLSQNEPGQWVMDVDQDPGEGDGAFDADVLALGSTAPRSLARRFADTVNVKDFGAKGDGTTDDTAAIQAAVTAARYKTLYFPHGNYVVSGKITVDKTIRMTGDSSYSSNIKTNTYNITMLEFTANGSVVLENLSFSGPQHWSSEEHGGKLVAFEPTTGENQGSRIRNCRFTYGVVGLDLRRNQQCFITHCSFSQFRLIGIRCNNEYNGDSGDSVISECTISSKRKDYSEDFPNYTYGILQYGGAGLRIVNNKVLGTDLGVDFNWNGQKEEDGQVREVGSAILLIESNSIEHCYRGVRIGNITAEKGFGHIVVTGNEITVPEDGCGVEVSASASSGSKIRGIIIADNSLHLNVDSTNRTYPENVGYDRKSAMGVAVYGGVGVFVGTNVMRGFKVGIQQQDSTYLSTAFNTGVRVSQTPENVLVAKQISIELANECTVGSSAVAAVKLVGVSEGFTASGTTGGEPDDGGWYATDEISHTFDISGGFAKIPVVVATPTADGCRCYVASKSATECSVVILSKEPLASVSAEVVAMC